jgi:hypothetical protein
MRRLNEAADIDLVVVDSRLPYPGLAEFLGEMRSDVHVGRLPVYVTIAPDLSPADALQEETRLAALARNDPNLRVIRGVLAAGTVELDVPKPGTTATAPLSDAERRALALRAIEGLRRAAELPGYDIQPAGATIRLALRSDDLAPAAIPAAGHLPTKEAQQDLANVVLGANRKPEVRVQAAAELARHIQAYTPVLSPAQVGELRTLALAETTPPALRERISAVVGALGPPLAQSGGELLRYPPPLPAPAPAAPKPPPGGTEKEEK